MSVPHVDADGQQRGAELSNERRMSFVTKGVETRRRIVVVDDGCDGVAPLSLQPHADLWRCLEVADVAGVASLLRYDPQGDAVARVADNGAAGLSALAADGL